MEGKRKEEGYQKVEFEKLKDLVTANSKILMEQGHQLNSIEESVDSLHSKVEGNIIQTASLTGNLNALIASVKDLTRKIEGNSSGLGEFNRVKQTGTVEEYVNKFEELREEFMTMFPNVTEQYCLNVFIDGLKEDLRSSMVKVLKPKTLDEAFEQALRQSQEGVIEMYLSVLFLEGNNGGGGLRIRGKIKNKEISVLISTGTTNSFIDGRLVEELKINKQSAKPAIVTLVDGSKFMSRIECKGVKLVMDGHVFRHDLRILGHGCTDLILGVDWVANNYPMAISFEGVSIKKDGKDVVLRCENRRIRDISDE